MNIRNRVAALEQKFSPRESMAVVFMDYRRTADGTVTGVCVNGDASVERLPGESMDDFDARALIAAQVTGSPVIKVCWQKPSVAV